MTITRDNKPSISTQELEARAGLMASSEPQQQPFDFFLEESFLELLAFLLLVFLPLDAVAVSLVAGSGAVVAGGSVPPVSCIMVDAPGATSPAAPADAGGSATLAIGAATGRPCTEAGTKALAVSTKLYWYCGCEKGWKVLGLGAPMGKMVFSWSCVMGWDC
mmetsp:Transcript_99437/g.290280  ORF Transcript_99437/g.290280 Transcript_99437/m.290280 type:complete len:162 (-) Transcript_99437:82-567(-)